MKILKVISILVILLFFSSIAGYSQYARRDSFIHIVNPPGADKGDCGGRRGEQRELPYTSGPISAYIDQEVEFIYHSDKNVAVPIAPGISSCTWSIWGGRGDQKTIFADEFRIVLKFPSPGYYTVGKGKDGSTSNATVHIRERYINPPRTKR